MNGLPGLQCVTFKFELFAFCHGVRSDAAALLGKSCCMTYCGVCGGAHVCLASRNSQDRGVKKFGETRCSGGVV